MCVGMVVLFRSVRGGRAITAINIIITAEKHWYCCRCTYKRRAECLIKLSPDRNNTRSSTRASAERVYEGDRVQCKHASKYLRQLRANLDGES